MASTASMGAVADAAVLGPTGLGGSIGRPGGCEARSQARSQAVSPTEGLYSAFRSAHSSASRPSSAVHFGSRSAGPGVRPGEWPEVSADEPASASVVRAALGADAGAGSEWRPTVSVHGFVGKSSGLGSSGSGGGGASGGGVRSGSDGVFGGGAHPRGSVAGGSVDSVARGQSTGRESISHSRASSLTRVRAWRAAQLASQKAEGIGGSPGRVGGGGDDGASLDRPAHSSHSASQGVALERALWRAPRLDDANNAAANDTAAHGAAGLTPADAADDRNASPQGIEQVESVVPARPSGPPSTPNSRTEQPKSDSRAESVGRLNTAIDVEASAMAAIQVPRPAVVCGGCVFPQGCWRGLFCPLLAWHVFTCEFRCVCRVRAPACVCPSNPGLAWCLGPRRVPRGPPPPRGRAQP